jgi:hypothetical protein
VTALSFLLAPVVIVAVGSVVIWWRGRQPSSVESGIESFRREMQALSPDAEAEADRRPPVDARRSPPRPKPTEDG